MKCTFLKIIILGILGISFLASCQKTTQPATPYTEIEGSWMLIQTATDDNNNGILDRNELVNVSSGYQEIIKFNKDLTGTQNITVNDTTNNYPFTWNLTNNYTDLLRFEEGDSIISHIDEINGSDLTLKNNTSPVVSWELYRKQ